MTRRDLIFALYISFEITTPSGTLIAAKYLKQLLAINEVFEKDDNKEQILEKFNAEFQATVGEAMIT